MDKQLAKNIAESTAHRKSREGNAFYVLKNPQLVDDLITLALDFSDKNHFKACWVLDIVLQHDITLLVPRLQDFCDSLPGFTNDSALRPAAKICMLCTQRLKKQPDFLNEKQIVQITEACFGWLVSDEKVAAKAYAIRTLYETGKLLDWVYPELIPVLQHGFPEHSAACKSTAKDVLSKIR